MWKAAGEMGQFGAFVQLLLLTAQRRDKVANLRWDDIDAKGVWTIRTEEREKGNPGTFAATQASLGSSSGCSRGSSATRMCSLARMVMRSGATAMPRSSSMKSAASKIGACMILRRTARSLMSRAGVSSEHAERVLGHAIEGVEGTYNRHAYHAEKADALRKLATLVERIVDPPTENVLELRAAQ